MANEEQLRRLKEEGVEAWNEWRRNNPGVEIDLSEADLSEADLTGANLNGAKLINTNLNGAMLISAHLAGADLTGADLSNAILTFSYLDNANLIKADLTEAHLNSAHLLGTNLTGADLTGADLNMVQALRTNFKSAKLTGACIKDWNIGGKTEFKNVICDYIYLENNNQERRPSDLYRNFEPDEFAKLVEQSIHTVDLVFKEGIDWRAFLSSFKDLRVEYGEQNVSIQAIEKKSDGAFVIRLNVPPDADKAEIESRAKDSYTKLAVLEAESRLLLKQNVSLENIVNTLAIRPINPINVEAKAVAESKSQGDSIKFEKSNVGVGVVKDSATANVGQVGGTTDKEQSESRTQAIKEIEQLLQELSQENPPKKESEKVALGEDAIERIENDPTWKQRVINAAKEGGLAAFEKALDNTAGAFITGVIRGWLEAEA